jgi:hypothetical protein
MFVAYLLATTPEPTAMEYIQSFFQNFVSSGQGTAAIVGLIVGYLFRGLTR